MTPAEQIQAMEHQWKEMDRMAARVKALERENAAMRDALLLCRPAFTSSTVAGQAITRALAPATSKETP